MNQPNYHILGKIKWKNQIQSNSIIELKIFDIRRRKIMKRKSNLFNSRLKIAYFT